MPPKPRKTLASQPIYANKRMRLREDVAELPDGRTTIYGVVSTSHCVGVLPFLADDRVVLVRQYRYVFGESQRWEMPTGGVHPNETPEQAAQRELREEVGYSQPFGLGEHLLHLQKHRRGGCPPVSWLRADDGGATTR